MLRRPFHHDAEIHDTGLTHHRLTRCEYELLMEFDIGLTDHAKRSNATDAGLRAGDCDVGEFRDKIGNARSRVLAFTGKNAASIHFGVPTKNVDPVVE